MRFNSLKNQFQLLFAIFVCIALGCLLLIVFFSERQAMKHRIFNELLFQTHLCEITLQSELEGACAELQGLRWLLDVYPPEGRMRDTMASLKVSMREWLNTYAFRYRGLALQDDNSHEVLALIPVREFETIEIVQKASRLIPVETAERLRRNVNQTSGEIVYQFEVTDAGELMLYLSMPVAGNTYQVIAVLPLEIVIADVRKSLTLPLNVVLAVADTAGSVFYSDNISDLQKPLNHVLREKDLATLLDRKGEPFIRQRSAHFLRAADSAPVLLSITADMKPEISQWQIRMLRMAGFSVGIAVIMWLLVGLVARALASSIGKVTKAVKRVSEGDLRQRVNIKRKDELGILIDSFNEMAGKLEASHNTINQVNRSLEEKIGELSRTREALTRNERLAVLGEAVSKVSHEIQNRISGVHIWVHNLIRYCKDDTQTAQTAEELESALNNIMSTLTHFKKFYRMPDPSMEISDLSELINSSLLRIRPETEAKDLKIRCSETEAVEILADREQIIDALVNVLINAVFYSPESGSLYIETVKDDESIRVIIADEGPGFEHEDSERFFEPFFSRKTGGSGLGLAIVKNIMEAHRGTVNISNGKRRGAVVDLRFPVPEVEKHR